MSRNDVGQLVVPLFGPGKLFFRFQQLRGRLFVFLPGGPVLLGGFLSALLLGTVLAVLAGRFRFVEFLLWPFVVMIKTVPVASFIIISLIWLTAKELSVFISFLMVLPLIYQNVLQGIKSADRQMLEMRHFDGLGNSECAELLKIQPKAASIRYVRALQKLREKLAEYTEFQP